MADEMKTAANWAKELGLPEKALKDALKGKEPDGKKGSATVSALPTEPHGS